MYMHACVSVYDTSLSFLYSNTHAYTVYDSSVQGGESEIEEEVVVAGRRALKEKRIRANALEATRRSHSFSYGMLVLTSEKISKKFFPLQAAPRSLSFHFCFTPVPLSKTVNGH